MTERYGAYYGGSYGGYGENDVRREAGYRGYGEDPVRREAGYRGYGEDPVHREAGYPGFGEDPVHKAAGYRGYGEDPVHREAGNRGYGEDPVHKAAGYQGYGEDPVHREAGYRGYGEDPVHREAGYRENYGATGPDYGDQFGEDVRQPYREDYGKQSQGNPPLSAATILKFGMAFLILVYIVLLLIYTSGSTKPFEEVASAVEEQLDQEALVKQDARALKRYYGLNSADYEGVMYYSAEFSISALEVLLVEVNTDQQVQEVRDAVEERLENRRNTFEGYAPEQAQLIEQAQILVRGRFIFLAVSPDAESYAAAFTNSL